jgi:hypothetical protein
MHTNFVTWYIKNRVILVRWPKEVSHDDVIAANADIVSLMDAGTPLVHILHDTLRTTNHPKNVFWLRKTFTFISHPTMGWFLTAASDPFIRFLGMILPQIDRNSRYRIFSDMPLLLDFLRERDVTLNWGDIAEMPH